MGEQTRESTGEAFASRERIVERLRPYLIADDARATLQVIDTALPFLLVWYLAYRSLAVSYALTVLLAVLAAGLMLRLVVLQHDLGHRSLFRAAWVNDRLGALFGVLTLLPFSYWRRTHAEHHSHFGNLDRRGPGYITTLTVREYRGLPRWRRILYRMYRNPFLVMFPGGLYYFLIQHRFPAEAPKSWQSERRSVYGTNLAILALVAGLSAIIGWRQFVAVHLPIVVVASSLAVWIFLTQHSFDDTYWEREDDWDFVDAGLHGSSHLKMPRILQWFTANVGLHHVHHLSPRIPNYHLQCSYDEVSDLRQVEPLTLRQSLDTVHLALWDESGKRLVRFGDLPPTDGAVAAPAAEHRQGRLRMTRSAAERIRGGVFIAVLNILPVVALVQGTSRSDWVAFALLYAFASLGLGIGLHRYFAHKSFKTSRAFQLVMAIAACCNFTDPIAFTGKHRLHHRFSDTDKDVHSPLHGLWFCWFGSLVDEGYTDREVTAMARDLTRYPELVWLHRFFYVPGLVLGAAVWLMGGFSMFAIGFCLSRALMIHAASAVNYFCHLWGRRRYDTRDDSRNNALVALLTLGEGWHNNHHHFPTSARAGFYWWEIDLLFYAIKLLSWLGIVWDVREVPERVRRAGRA